MVLPDGTALRLSLIHILIPMMTLGIPGNAVTAILMGALMLHGLTPGNDLFTVKADITYPFIFGLAVSAFIMVVVGVLGARQFAKVNRIPQNFLASGILVLTVLGAFSCNNSYADVIIMLACGILGYVLKQQKIDLSAVVLGYILGPVSYTHLDVYKRQLDTFAVFLSMYS